MLLVCLLFHFFIYFNFLLFSHFCFLMLISGVTDNPDTKDVWIRHTGYLHSLHESEETYCDPSTERSCYKLSKENTCAAYGKVSSFKSIFSRVNCLTWHRVYKRILYFKNLISIQSFFFRVNSLTWHEVYKLILYFFKNFIFSQNWLLFI